MAKSVRSKRRQRVLAVRREKYKAVERKKCWDHHLRRQRERIEDMDGVIEKTETGTEGGGDEVAGGGKDALVMETDADKSVFSKKYLEKLSKAWKGRREKRKKKRLCKKHNKW